jgi:hypothetical protein
VLVGYAQEFIFRSYNAWLSHSVLYVYTSEVNAVACSAGFVCNVVLKGQSVCYASICYQNAIQIIEKVKSEAFWYFVLRKHC